MSKNTILFFLSFLLFFACGKEKTATSETSTLAKNGHEKMVAMLDSIARTASPKDCYMLNTKAAEMLAAQIQPGMTPQQEIPLRFRYAQELLYSGATEAAAVELKKIIEKLGNQLSAQTKPIWEMLAISYLRLGEQQNCIERHNAESCIVPVKGQGVYAVPTGMEAAIQVYTQILAAFPDDYQSRWLLNLAYMNLGEYPDGVPAEHRVPPSVFRAEKGAVFNDVAGPSGVDVLGLSGGVCMEDFDGDGLLDIFATSYGLRDQARFFKNVGGGKFAERTEEAGLTGIVSGLNTIHADYDNDGDRDILILRGGWLDGGTHPNSLLQNDGKGNFRDVTEAAGLLSFHPTQTAAWADFDADGHLDLYIANESKRSGGSHPNELFRNNGDGTFTDVAASLGVDFQGFFKGCAWGDVNGDRLPDLYLSNISGQNILLLNRSAKGTSGKFENVTESAQVGQPLMSFPTWFFDYNNDGREDLLVAGYDLRSSADAAGMWLRDCLGNLPEGDWFRLYENATEPDGVPAFKDVTKAVGLNRATFAMGSNFGDLDNDGYPDIYIGTGTPDFRSLLPNRMFKNVMGKRFEEVTMNGFAHVQKGHGVAFGDVDNDGDQDIYAVMGGAYEGDLAHNVLFENPGTAEHAWVCIELEGTTCNRDGIGSKIAVHTVQKGGAKQVFYASVNTGGSFGSASLRQEIGLGQAEAIEKVEVFWAGPSTKVSVLRDVSLGSFVKCGEGKVFE